MAQYVDFKDTITLKLTIFAIILNVDVTKVYHSNQILMDMLTVSPATVISHQILFFTWKYVLL